MTDATKLKITQLWMEIQESKEYKSLLRSQGSQVFTFVAMIPEVVELAHKLKRLDSLTPETFISKINMGGFNRLRKMNDMIVELRDEVQTVRFGGQLTGNQIQMWRDQGKSLEEIVELMKGN